MVEAVKPKQDSPSHDTHDEGYFASFTDMLVGIIFIFIILLMIVANDFQTATESITKISHELDEARNEARDRERDAARDRARDEARDRVRDAARDKAIAESKSFAETQAVKATEALEEAKALTDALAQPKAPLEVKDTSEAKTNDDTKQLKAIQQNLFNDSRGKVLLKIQEMMTLQGFPVVVDINQGALIIPENLLFDLNVSEINYKGKQAIDTLASSLNTYLPCIAPTSDANRLIECSSLGFPPNDGLDAIFIDDYPDIEGSKEDKLLLAVQHIVSVFGELKRAEPYLDKGLKNKFGAPVLNIKVNQARRDARNRDQDNAAVKDSVVLRFMMRAPNEADIMKLQNSGEIK